ncbi:MAG: Glu-tRNA(Gln) amidotransferase subunit GatD [Thermoplasmatota archaeon]
MREKLLEGIDVGDRIKIEDKERSYEGILMPHHRFSDEDIITIKLDNGYNIGYKINGNTEVDLIQKREGIKSKKEKSVEVDESKPKISIIGTGGTIASYVEYKTGAVHPAQSAEDVLYSNPEIGKRCNPKVDILFSKLSENIEPQDWVKIADKVIEEIEDGAEGIVISHGTDTMGYTSAALSFLLQNLPVPVVLVGSQRSSDRPSSDAHLNLLSAVEVAKSELNGVYVVMHESMSDDRSAIHKGTKVRKMHTSRRDAFRSINTEPVGFVDPESGEFELNIEPQKPDGELKKKGDVVDDVSLIYAHPGLTEEDIKNAGNSKGIVIAGTGLGHMKTKLIPELKKVIGNGTPVVMTSQCLNGTINDHVYSAGRQILEAGVIPGKDMLPETALVKLMWALSLDEDVEEMMKTDIAGEINERRTR